MMTNNDEMKKYDFIEGTEFEGLMSKAIDAAPGTVGESDVLVKFFDTSKGCTSMKVVDLWAFYESSEGGEEGGSETGGTESGGTEESGSTESGGTESGGTEDSGSTESGGTESGGTEEESGSTESGGTESGSTESGSTESGSTESGSTESGSTESGSTESGGTEDSGSTESGGTESGGTEEESGTTEPEVVRPEEIENTPAQEQANQDLNDAVTDPEGGTKAYSAVVESINNITLPANAGRSATISGDVQNGATIVNEASGSSRYITLTGTQEEPVDVSVITSGGTVYLRGEYNDIYLEGKQIGVSSSIYPNIHGTVSVADTDQPVTVNANFVGEDCGVVYLGDDELTVSDGNTAVTASPTIYAPNATVNMAGKYDEVTVTCSENTLNLKSGFHANKLVVLKGNVFVNGVDINDFVDELVLPEGSEVRCAEFHVTQDSNAKLMGSSPANGTIILDSDIELTKGRAYSALASGKEVIDLNGHTWRCGDTRATDSNLGSYYMRGSKSNVTIKDSVGGGLFENNHADYLVFMNGVDAVMNIESGEYRGYTHTLYSLLGTINVYGGTFKLLDADTAERDANGNLKFLLNCYDANYTAGTAKINVYGGKFYEFNPAVTYGEPGGPVSYVAEGYKVVESTEDGKKVYEVVPDESQLEPIIDNGQEGGWD